MKSHFSYLLVFALVPCFAQKNTDTVKAESKFALFASVGKSSFVISLPATDFASTEARLGLEYKKPLNRHFDFITSFQLGIKFKRESYLNGQFYSQPGFPLLSVNETASNRDHWLIELPLLLQYSCRYPRLNFRGGIAGRSWFPNNDDVDMLTARREFGLAGGIRYRTKVKVDIGVDFYEGVTKINSGAISQPNGTISYYEIRNRSIQGSIVYHL